MEKLEPSKENARKALETVRLLPEVNTEVVQWLEAFLKAAERKLPSQASIDRDRLRRKKPVDL